MAKDYRLLSINIGEERMLQIGSKTSPSGIYKLPAESAEVTKLGLEGDCIVSKKHHGGPDQAIYVYTREDYDSWQKEAALFVDPGTFGENLVVSGLESASMVIGDQLIFGTVVLEVTSPRFPCATFAAKMGDPEFVKKFKKAERPGFYCRVIKEGRLVVGEGYSIQKAIRPAVTILDLYRNHYHNERDAERVKLFLSAPIAIRVRKEIEKQPIG